MITHYPYSELGHADYGWLDAHYHFSFAHYHNPHRTGFGKLLVINDDTVKAGRGFEMHPHRDMEIITFVRSGAITHRDSRGNEGRTEAGSVQVMTAGTGIYHSEFNLESEDTTLYQIWIQPREKGVAPYWETAQFAERAAQGVLPLLVSGRAEDADKDVLYIHQDAAISGGQIPKGGQVTQPIKEQAYLLVSSGEIMLDGETLRKGDGAEIIGQNAVDIRALTDAEVILIDVPA